MVAPDSTLEFVTDLEVTDLVWLAQELGLGDAGGAGAGQLREATLQAMAALAQTVAKLQVPTLRAILVGYAPQQTGTVVPAVASPKPNSISRTATALQPEPLNALAYGCRLRSAYQLAERGLGSLQQPVRPARNVIECALQASCSTYVGFADERPLPSVAVRLSQAVAFAGRYQIALSYALPALALWLEAGPGPDDRSDVEQVIKYSTLRARLWARLAEHTLLMKRLK